jgi:tRNA 2-thiouridine synthesizing protein A
MMTAITADHTLDARGLICPMPVIRTSQKMKEIAVGDILELLATDPGSVSDMKFWCKSTGNELISTEHSEGVFRFYIRRSR